MRQKEILALNAFDRAAGNDMGPELHAAVERRLRSFGSSAVLFYEQPLRMAHGEGVWLQDEAGRRYLDAYNNVQSVGHCHPRVVEAVQRQMGLLNTHTRYLNDLVDAYAERLLATFPAAISRVVLTCTGSEANDLALRIAQAGAGRTGFVVTEAAYHGNTSAVAEVSPSSRPGRPLAPHVRTVAAPDAYRQPAGDLGLRFAAAVSAAIDDLERNGIRFAGLLADTIFSSDGVFADPPGFLTPAVELARARGGVFIADEVQPGFARTGAALWGFLRHAVTPDIVTMGKPMGNGFPMGGVATRPDLLDRFTAETRYFNTFGGNPVAAAAGFAVLDVIEDEGLLDNARTTGAYLMNGLRSIAERRPCIGDVRGAGLFVGLELVRNRDAKDPAPEIATALINGMRERGILVGAAGAYGNTLKIRPPLCFSRQNADMLVEACDVVLSQLTAARPDLVSA
jgi:4-aminobutyrate aminotransferase-like enzyme